MCFPDKLCFSLADCRAERVTDAQIMMERKMRCPILICILGNTDIVDMPVEDGE